MKKILILVLSCETPPYGKMIETSMKTWDSVNVDGCESLYYCGVSKNQNTNNIVYLPVHESLATMGEKTLQALEYALKNCEFDYIARVHSSCYVSKQKLIDYVQGLPDTNLFEGLVCPSQNGFDFVWGGGHYIISKDVVKAICDNRKEWNHKYMEDESMSLLVAKLGIPFKNGNSCSINKTDRGWMLLSYGYDENQEFKNFSEIKTNHYFYRVKQDGKRDLDEYIMHQLHANNT